MKKLLHLYLFLFIFNVFNKEFMPFIDLRYIILFIATILMVLGIMWLTLNRKEIKIQKLYGLVILLYFFIFFSNINWLRGDLILNKNVFNNLMLLNAYNFIAIIIIVGYKSIINYKKVVKYIIVSGIILFISLVLVYIGIDIQSFFGNQAKTFVIDQNFIGSNIRISGFAEDPNYTSFLMIMLFATAYKFIDSKVFKFNICSMCIIGYLFSSSKTVFIAGIISITIIKLTKNNSTLKNTILKLSLLNIFLLPIMLIEFNLLKFNLSTMATRIDMWSSALALFKKHILFGAGMSGFRSYFMIDNWYVQCHSTIFQVLSENGLITLIILFVIYCRLINTRSDYYKFILMIFISLNINFEMIYLPFFPFTISLLAFLAKEDFTKSETKKEIGNEEKDTIYNKFTG